MNKSSTVAGVKREPASNIVSPAGVSQIGSAMGNHATSVGKILNGASKPLYEGRGFEAPMNDSCSSNCGSQGKY